MKLAGELEDSAPAVRCEPPETADVIVLGAGVVGVSTAYALARRGLTVTLVDREAGPAKGASFANGAQLSYAYSDPLGGPGLLKSLPALALGIDPAFKLRPTLDPEMISWGLSFIRSCTDAQQRSGTLANLKLALESRRALHDLLARHPFDFGHVVAGKMHLHFDRPSLAVAERQVALKRGAGAVQHMLTADEAIAIEPALRGAANLVGVVYSPEDEVGDPYRFSVGLVELLARRYRANLAFGFDATKLDGGDGGVVLSDREGGKLRARTIVVALGCEAAPFLRRLGIRVPILPMKGYSFTAPPGEAAPSVSLTDTARKLVFCNLSGEIRVAGIAELGARAPGIIEGRLSGLVSAARASLPQAADYEAITHRWTGFRPMTPSSAPIISRPRDRIILNVGQGMLGWTLAMGSAERAATLVLEALGQNFTEKAI